MTGWIPEVVAEFPRIKRSGLASWLVAYDERPELRRFASCGTLGLPAF